MDFYITTWLGVTLFIHTMATQCIWNLQDLPNHEPIFYRLENNKPSFLLPTADLGLVLNAGEKIKVLCSGPNNNLLKSGRRNPGVACGDPEHVLPTTVFYFDNTVDMNTETNRNPESEITCVKRLSILVDGKSGTLNDLDCKVAVSSEVLTMKTTCANIGTTMNIGYHTAHGWLALIELCYDFKSLITLYAQIPLYGNLLSVAYEQPSRGPELTEISHSTAGLPPNIDFNEAYSKKNQAAVFQRTLGTSTAINANSYLLYGHLVSRLDLIFHSWQRSTNYFVNVVPEWLTIGIGNWKLIANSLRQYAMIRKSTLKMWIGTSGVLILKGPKTGGTKMYLLNNNRLPIPKYIWKVACTIQNHCIAFVVHNDISDSSVICRNRCRETNWYRDGFNDVTKGLVVCCELEEFKKALDVLHDVTASGILNS